MGESKNKHIGMMALVILVTVLLAVGMLSGCTEEDKAKEIVVISRESTSGTREFFYEHVLDEEDFSGDALEKTSNGEVHDTVSQTPQAIGYIGLGYLDKDVKALKVDGVEATVANVLSGDYPISRDLYMFTKDNASGLEKEFLDFVMSTTGKEIVEEEGYVPLAETTEYNTTGKNLSGSLSISGSTTVLPVAQQAASEFQTLFPDVTIDVTAGGSSAGISDVSAGNVDIGMASRDLKETEQNLGLVKHTICSDGIAIVVHPSNDYVEDDDITMEQIKSIYTGSVTDWTKI